MPAGSDPLEVLLELTRVLGTNRPLEEELQFTTDAALRLLPADHTSLRLFDDERRQLVASARSGTGRTNKPVSFQAGEGVAGVVADTGRGARVSDTREDPRFKDMPTGFSIRSLVAVPVRAGGRVIGVLSASSAEPEQFSARDMDLAQLIANCAAPAIETARLGRLAVTDDLTRAYNFRYYTSRMPEEVSRARRYDHAFSLLILDLDHFKLVNDRYGHQVGDEVLSAVADRIRTAVREPDIFIRRGGEEFALLMPETDPLEACAVAQRIVERVAERPLDTSAGPIPLTVSIGAATWVNGEEVAELEARADGALYRAKDSGRNRVEHARDLDGTFKSARSGSA